MRDEWYRPLVAPEIKKYTRNPSMPGVDDICKAIHDGDLTYYELPKGYHCPASEFMRQLG